MIETITIFLKRKSLLLEIADEIICESQKYRIKMDEIICGSQLLKK